MMEASEFNDEVKIVVESFPTQAQEQPNIDKTMKLSMAEDLTHALQTSIK